MFQVLAFCQSEWNIQNSVDNTKLHSYTLPPTVSLETHSLYFWLQPRPRPSHMHIYKGQVSEKKISTGVFFWPTISLEIMQHDSINLCPAQHFLL